jgi:hypothetical protein
MDEYKIKAENIQTELVSHGFMATRIEKGENLTDYNAVFFDGESDYIIRRDHHNEVIVSDFKYRQYENVSNHTSSGIYKKYHNGSFKVITAKKIQDKIDSLKIIHKELLELEAVSTKKIADFMESLKGLEVYYSKDYNGVVKGGHMDINGISYRFEIGDNGYVGQDISISYSVDKTLENFLRLASNSL